MAIRRSHIVFFASALLILGATLVLANFFSQPSPQTESDRLQVATSIFPLTDITHRIGQGYVDVVQLLPNGASPHTHTLTAKQVSDLRSVRALFIIGHNLDNWATKPVASAGIPVFTVDEGITLLPFADHDEASEAASESHEEYDADPHYWLTAPNGQQIARNITKHLQALDPAHADVFATNLSNYLTELEALEQELQSLANSASQRHFIAIHNGWSYFAQQYQFELVDTYEPREGQSPTFADLQRLQENIDEYRLDTFFTEPQKESSAGIRVIEQELGLSIKVLDPLGGLENRSSYKDLLRYNVIQIAR